MTSLAAMTAEQRSVHIARIRGRDTRPERLVQDMLVAADVKFRTHVADLPGTPDVVVYSRRTVVFVNGCFWHRHGCRRGSSKIKKNRDFWRRKFAANVSRDKRAARALRRDGWVVLTVWECEITSAITLLPRLLRALAPGRKVCAHGPHVAVKGRVLCDPCARYNRERIRSGSSSVTRPRVFDEGRGARWELLGLCRKCRLPARDGRRTCHKCARSGRVGRHAARIRALADRGLCRCGRRLAPSRKRCRRCLKRLRDDAKARYAARARLHTCVQCPTKVKKGRLCGKHKRRARLLARARLSRSQVIGPTSSEGGTRRTRLSAR